MKRRFFRMLTLALLTVLCTFGIFAGCMIAQQDKMIYMPRTYTVAERESFRERGLIALAFETSQGLQTAHWLPPSDPTGTPANIWLVFSGNGGCATDYADVARSGPKNSGWLFVDYPSYGACQGQPNPATIRETSLASIDALTEHLQVSKAALLPRLGVFGHSIGAAVALDTAAEAGLKRVIAVSPFTSMKDMAARFVTPLLAGFIRHRFDNRATIDRVVNQGASVTILHGTADTMIPVEMGRSLAKQHGDIIHFVGIEGAGHNDVIDIGSDQIAHALRESEG